jgi:hypothetical protein
MARQMMEPAFCKQLWRLHRKQSLYISDLTQCKVADPIQTTYFMHAPKRFVPQCTMRPSSPIFHPHLKQQHFRFRLGLGTRLDSWDAANSPRFIENNSVENIPPIIGQVIHEFDNVYPWRVKRQCIVLQETLTDAPKANEKVPNISEKGTSTPCVFRSIRQEAWSAGKILFRDFTNKSLLLVTDLMRRFTYSTTCVYIQDHRHRV